ncbi:hypothetical protein ALC62_06836 [Cyphomyrmex costatus]|uniref:MADF domain-containing protein n=1 Tax=Cyphomyrmex costatus TaxID=456900 RepID=A0A151IIU8_9HYME|nr:hypothetical protein ALC62_06836 [Cyphomyrmex costatus]
MTNLRKERESKNRCSGKSPEEIYKPKWVLYDRLKFLIKSCAQAESLSNLQISENTIYSDKTEFLINDNTTEATKSPENVIEYLESEFDITQFNLRNTQQWQTSSTANTSEREMYCPLDNTSCSSINSLSKASSLSHHDSQLDISSGSSTAKSAVHLSTSKKQTSDNKENIYIKRGSAKKRKGSIVEEAMGAIKLLSEQTSENDSAEHFGVFVASRLREMYPEIRKQCEQEIMNCLVNH